VIAARTARTRHGDALVRIDCASSSPCSGELKLVAKVAERRRHRRNRAPATHGRIVLVGKASFSLAAGESNDVDVPLTRAGRGLLADAGRGGLRVQLSGTRVEATTIELR